MSAAKLQREELHAARGDTDSLSQSPGWFTANSRVDFSHLLTVMSPALEDVEMKTPQRLALQSVAPDTAPPRPITNSAKMLVQHALPVDPWFFPHTPVLAPSLGNLDGDIEELRLPPPALEGSFISSQVRDPRSYGLLAIIIEAQDTRKEYATIEATPGFLHALSQAYTAKGRVPFSREATSSMPGDVQAYKRTAKREEVLQDETQPRP